MAHVVDVSERPPAAGRRAQAGRAGRNLPVALAVGLAMGALVLATLYTAKPVFLGVVVLAIVVGMYELTRALGGQGHARAVHPAGCSARSRS